MMEDLRVRRLDKAFLFGVGTVGLLITFLNIMRIMEDLGDVIEVVPFILLGMLLPIIVGYKRGAIEMDSVEERVRGWIYLIIGMASYFAFFIFQRIDAQWIYREMMFIVLVVLGVYLAYRFLKWSRRVFNFVGNHYAFSGTMFSAFVCTFVCRLAVSYYLDFFGMDISRMIQSGSPEPIFWISVIIASLSIALIFERASRNALGTVLDQPSSGRSRRFLDLSPVKGVRLAFMLFESAFGSSLEASFLWIQAFAFWMLGCLLWIVNVEAFPHAFFLLAIAFSILAIRYYVHVELTFEHIENLVPFTLLYCLILAYALLFPLFYRPFLFWSILIIALCTIHYLLTRSHDSG